MANPAANSRFPEYEREAKPWLLPNTITESVCILAGREASAALRIALGKHSGATAAHQATYHEPFTFWDWHGVHPDDTYAREWKSQRMWEHQRGFTVDGLHVYGYPTSRQRWARFKEDLECDPAKREWVQKLAVAHWMGAEDLLWIAENLLQLTALDLGDAPFADSQESHSWSDLVDPDTLKPSKIILELLRRLEWLALPDFRNSDDTVASLLVGGFLDSCSGLSTLCIRPRQSSNDITDPHDFVCKLPGLITTHGRSQLKRLELRLPFFCLDALMAGLVDEGSRIRHIGIDLGAWIQLLPRIERSTNDLSEKDVKKVAKRAAKKQRFEAYEVAHEERFTAEQQWRLPESRIENHAPESLESNSENAKHIFEQDYYNADRQLKRLQAPLVAKCRWTTGCGFVGYNHTELQQSVTNMDPNTLPEMLGGMYQAANRNPEFTLFPLQPERQQNSNGPLHPFALINRPVSMAALSDSKSSFTPGLHKEVYTWLNTTFKWRPIFDWEFYITRSDTAQDRPDKQLWEQYGLDSPDFACHDPHAELAEQLHSMRSVGIPIHILMGRRHTGTPSLYWGWPYDASVWSKWLTAPFGANIGLFAPLVDTLSIMYDLRDPIRTAPALEIASSTCPRPVCPWARAKFFCPFKDQWNPTPISPRGQKMANRHTLRPPLVLKPFAPQIDGLPPVGRYDPASPAEQSPHVLAAFKREAVGWHRFWSKYAPQFTQLTQLNVRMPASFDTVGSLRLARLLDAAKGWREVHYATENGEIDLGGFVRRTWICQDPKVSISDVGESETEREEDQFQKAIKMVEEAVRECEGVELELQPTPDNEIELGLRDGYGQRMHRVAEEAWRSQLREYVIELADHMTASSENEPVRRVLQRTRRALEARVLQSSSFQPGDIFTHDPEFRNNIGLVNHPSDYSAAENERRARPAFVEPLPGYISDDSIYNASPSPQTRDFAYDAPPAADTAVQDNTAEDAAATDTAQIKNPLPGLQPTQSLQSESEAPDTSTQADGGVKSPVNLRGVNDAVQRPRPPTAQLPGLIILQQQDDPDMHVPTDLDQILATLSRPDATNTQQSIEPQPQVAYNSEVDRLLATLQQNTQHGQMAPVQHEPSRWTGDTLLDELEDYVEGSVAHGFEEKHGALTNQGEASNVQPTRDIRTAEIETHVHTLAHCIPGLNVLPTPATSTVIQRREITQTQVIKGEVGEDAPAQRTQQAPAQEINTVTDSVEHREAVPSSVPSQPKASVLKDKTTRDEKLSQPTDTKPNTKTVSPKRPSLAKKTREPKTPKVSKTAKTKEKPDPIETSEHPEPPATPKASDIKTASAPSKHESFHPVKSAPLPPSPPAKKPPAKRRRKDPVIPDEPVDLSEGRKLRSRTRSRSNTPVYTEEHSDDEGDGDGGEGKGGKGKGGKKGKGKKRAADEEWEEGSGEGDGGKGGKKKRGK